MAQKTTTAMEEEEDGHDSRSEEEEEEEDGGKYPAKLWAYIRERSVEQASFAEAAKEWVFQNVTNEESDDVDCPCGHKHIHKLCHLHNPGTSKWVTVGCECVKWFGERLAQVAQLALSLVAVRGVYEGPTRSGHQLSFCVHGRLKALAKDTVFRGYYVRLPWLRVRKRWHLYVYDRRRAPLAPLQRDTRYRLSLQPRSSRTEQRALILELTAVDTDTNTARRRNKAADEAAVADWIEQLAPPPEPATQV